MRWGDNNNDSYVPVASNVDEGSKSMVITGPSWALKARLQ